MGVLDTLKGLVSGHKDQGDQRANKIANRAQKEAGGISPRLSDVDGEESRSSISSGTATSKDRFRIRDLRRAASENPLGDLSPPCGRLGRHRGAGRPDTVLRTRTAVLLVNRYLGCRSWASCFDDEPG
jgi:hypothetical protein